jgi:hypothetical protein
MFQLHFKNSILSPFDPRADVLHLYAILSCFGKNNIKMVNCMKENNKGIYVHEIQKEVRHINLSHQHYKGS